MASVRKTKVEKAKGKAGRYTAYWRGADGKRHSRIAFTDRGSSLNMAMVEEAESTKVRLGLVDPADRKRLEASYRAAADHVADYCLTLRSRSDTAKHVRDVRQALTRLLADASVVALSDLDLPRVEQALGRFRVERSARTTNKVAGYVRAWLRWLRNAGRLRDVPAGFDGLGKFNEAVDQRRVRRVLSPDELVRLLTVTEAAPPVVATRGKLRGARPKTYITGPERATLYRLAMGTGFRAEELRTLTLERFKLDGPKPSVTVLACYAKNGKEAVQPITRELADALRPFIEGKEPGRPVVTVPVRTAKMLQADLRRAEIDPGDPKTGVVDFHALRNSYITHLVASGANPKVVQILARHSTITLTMDRYCKVGEADLRKALEGKG